MNISKEKLITVAAAGRAKVISDLYDKKYTPSSIEFQAAKIIANRHRLTLQHSILVCSLAGIGGYWE